MLVEEGEEAHIDVVQRAEATGEVETSLAQRSPKALHLASGGCVVRLGVQERGAHPRRR